MKNLKSSRFYAQLLKLAQLVNVKQTIKFVIREVPAFSGLSLIACLVLVQSAYAQQPTARKLEIIPPPSAAVYARPGSVILKAGSTNSIIKSLTVTRTFSLLSLRRQPSIKLGKSRVDMSPLLKNPVSLVNITSRLQSRPALVSVIAKKTEALQVTQGLIVHQFLNYHVKLGVCSNSVRRQQLMQTGTRCAAHLTVKARAAAYTNPNDPHYVANPAKRAQVIAIANRESAKQKADLDKGIAKFRSMMKDPAQRAKVVAQLGVKEANRLATLNNQQLEAAAINSADIKIEDIMYIPKHNTVYTRRVVKAHLPVLRSIPPQKVGVEHSLQEHIFLTGFTLGNQYEWRRRVSVTVNTCLVSCKVTYFVEVNAGFDYGFGLRFPIKVGGLYAYHRAGRQESATVAPVFEPINGNVSDYAATGLPGDKIFNGKELVAEVQAHAGMNFKVPFYTDGVSFKVGKDFTKGLPAPFTNGQFRPPAPGDHEPLEAKIIFDNPDLLGGLANYGVVGAQVLPGVKAGLTCDLLQLTLKDDRTGKVTEMHSSGRPYPLSVNPKDHSSSFTIGKPEYQLKFKVTPGLAARVFVDVAVWSHHWDWPVWFPQIAITLPPGGAHFTCHERTICSRDYHYSPTLAKETQGETVPPHDLLEKEVFKWRNSYRKKYITQCPMLPLHFCQAAIEIIIKNTGNAMIKEMRAQGKYPSKQAAIIMMRKVIEADKKGKAIILENKIAAVAYYGKNLFKTYEPVWNHDCADQLCRQRIHALGQPYINALKKRQKASPSLSRNQVVSRENTDGHWAARAKKEVTVSLIRSGALKRVIIRPQYMNVKKVLRLTH
ncbi:MAG: hypothetical protein P8Z72_15425 [Gammaproteobacteria bacterium]